jgi:O-antigen/teichoic acid export membrane protein
MFPYNSSIEAHQAKKRTDSVVRNFLLVMSLIASVLFLLSRPFMALLYGAQYQDSVLYFRLILPTLVFFPVYKFQIVHLTSVGLSREATKVSFYSLPIIGVLSFLLIPRMGALGACLSLSLTNFLLALISMYYYLKYTNSTLLEVLKFTDEDYGYYRAFWLKLKLGTRS